MMNSEHAPGYVPNSDYSQEDRDEVSDNPESTDAEIAELRPDGEGLLVKLMNAFEYLIDRRSTHVKE